MIENAENGNIENIVMALLFAAEEPLSVRRIGAILEDSGGDEIHRALEAVGRRLDEGDWSVVLEKVAGGYQLSTRQAYATFIARMYSGRRRLRLSKAALETLAIIAYKQPITRSDVENIRGVGCGGVLTNLMDRGLIRITGKAKVLGAPFLYGSTQEFLEYLGLNSLKDLPSMDELEALMEREAGGKVAPSESSEGMVEPQGPSVGCAANEKVESAVGASEIAAAPVLEESDDATVEAERDTTHG